MENKFGNVKFISQNEFSKGYLLRENKIGVVLEKYYDEEHQNVDVVAEFEGAHLSNEADLHWLLSEFRDYVVEQDVILYVTMNQD